MSDEGFALIAVFTSASIKLIYRFSMKSGVDAWSLLIYYNLAAAATLLVFLPIPDISSIESQALYLLLLNGVLWAAAGLLDLRSYQYLSATDSDIYGSVKIVLLTLAGVLFFGEVVSGVAFIGIGAILAAMLLNQPVREWKINRGALYKLSATVVCVRVRIVFKQLTTMLPVETIALLGFFVPGLIFALIRFHQGAELIKAVRSYGRCLALVPLLGALRYFCVIQAFATGELIVTTMSLQGGGVLLFLYEFLFIKERVGNLTRGACSFGCLFGATLTCL